MVTDDGSSLTTQLAQQLTEQGWKVVILRLASITGHPLPSPEVQQVFLNDLSEAHLQQRLADITAMAGPPSVFVHLHPASANSQGEAVTFSKVDAAIVKQVFFLAKWLKPALTQAAKQGRSAFLTVARLDGEFGLGQQRPFSAIAAGLFGLTKTLHYEWNSVFCRALDMAPDMTAPQVVERVLAELHDPDRRLPEVAWGPSGRTTLIAAS